MDHFALPDDELAMAQEDGTLQRNFQGYSTHADTDLISCGVSAISAVGAATVWRFIYEARPAGQPQIGLFNAVWTRLGFDPVDQLLRPLLGGCEAEVVEVPAVVDVVEDCQSASKKDPLSASKRDPLRRAA